MKFITFPMIIFGAIATSQASKLPNNKDIYVLDKPTTNNIYISLLPMENPTKNTEKEPKEFKLFIQKIKENMKRMTDRDVKSDEKVSDITSCTIKAEVTFLGCLGIDTDGLKDTIEEGLWEKCLRKAWKVFTQCLFSKPSSAVLDNYAPNVVMHMK